MAMRKVTPAPRPIQRLARTRARKQAIWYNNFRTNVAVVDNARVTIDDSVRTTISGDVRTYI